MTHVYTPAEMGLDALGVQPGMSPAIAFEMQGFGFEEQVSIVNQRIERTMLGYPEIRIEILAAGMQVLLELSKTMDDLRSAVLPRLDRLVDNVAT